ncbi:sugar phosphate isomerase/epimerase family protein [Martelella soudanensis]|uniref:sugar phosphate isomerase/epimerase family protein n=1 Tax=unclassified Martelella TaxID=2629616 RepID=UPI0015DF706F|nr:MULTISPECIES: sugar phosphate isomerase/epimerase family protein [unclassified Martelella]
MLKHRKIDIFNPPGAGPQGVDRWQAAATLSAVDLPLALPYAPENWPIAAAMLQFPSTTAGGKSMRVAGPERWLRDLAIIAAEGFNSVEIPSAWLSIGELDRHEHEDLKSVLAQVGLSVCATSVVRRSIIEEGREQENMAISHAAIDGAAAVGSPLICLGLHEALQPGQLDATWFWTMPTHHNPDDREVWNRAVAGYRELADHAASVGVQISLELYEGTFLCSADSAVAFLQDIDRDNVGLNPDLGNLVRAQMPIEPWESMAIKTFPYANYWHVKNYSRVEFPENNLYLTTPTPMESGFIDYRKAISFAVAHGFQGAFLCENYGGDGLSVSAENGRYIQRVLKSISLDVARPDGAPRIAARTK